MKERRYWTTGELERLKAAAAAGTPNKEIAKQLGRSYKAISAVMSKRNIVNSLDTRKRYTVEETARIVEMREQNFQWKEIAQETGRGVWAVKKRYYSTRKVGAAG